MCLGFVLWVADCFVLLLLRLVGLPLLVLLFTVARLIDLVNSVVCVRVLS